MLASSGDPFPGSAFAAPVYRIPALAVTGSGRVLAAYDVRLDWRDLPGDFDIALRHSDDHGLTWSDARVLRRHEPGRGFGDASFVVDPDSGRVFCWYVGSTGRSFFSAEAGPDAAGLELWLSVSDDDGLTWRHRDLTALKPADVTGMFASSGNGSVTRTRLLQPFVLRTTDGQHYAATAYSDDGGDTWTLGERVGPDCDENKVLGLPDGSVLLHARATPRRRAARSVDGGRTFSAPCPTPRWSTPRATAGWRCSIPIVAPWWWRPRATTRTSAPGCPCAPRPTSGTPGPHLSWWTREPPPTRWRRRWRTGPSGWPGRPETTTRSSSPASTPRNWA